MTLVKICGLRRLDDARVAVAAGADLLGFVFAPSRRWVEPETARDIISGLRDGAPVKTVGVFVNADPSEMNRLAALCDLDYIQLSGDEPDDIAGQVDRPVIRVIHVSEDVTSRDLAAGLELAIGDVLLLDSARAGTYGGTGRTFDWSLLPELSRPTFLGGGLRAGNVERAIAATHPTGVDVSGGVETDGTKDPDKIREFVRAAKAADATSGA